jgi:hypothetical protein
MSLLQIILLEQLLLGMFSMETLETPLASSERKGFIFINYIHRDNLRYPARF